MRTVFLLALVVIAAGPATMPAAASSRFDNLPMATDETRERSFGTIRSVLARLRRRDPSCTLDTYEYGGSISCGARPGEPGSARVIIDFHAVPTRYPDLALITHVRLNGVNGGELPQAERERALSELIGRPARRRAR